MTENMNEKHENMDENLDVGQPDDGLSPQDLDEAMETLQAAEDVAQADDNPASNDEAQARIAELEAELAKVKDAAMRSLAEADNIRKRSERAQADASKFAVSKFAKDLLDVADNFRRALDSIPQEQKDSEDPMLKNLIIGIEASERSMLSVFERHGISKLEPKDGKFDPNFHEVMFEAEDPSKNPGEIIQLIEPGYMLHERLLRPARVGVAKGSATKAANVDASA